MRVLTLTRGFYPAVDFGGPAIASYHMTRGLAARGHDVTVYTSNLLDRANKLYPSTVERDVDGVRVVYMDTLWHYNYAAIAPDIARYCRREMKTFDVVNIYGFREFLTPVVASYARGSGVPYVIQPLGNLPRHSRSKAIKLLYDALLGHRVLRGARKVIARSELEAEQVRAFGVPRHKIAVVPNGVAPAKAAQQYEGDFRARYGIPVGIPMVLYLGRIASIKALHLLLEAFARLETHAHLVLAGPPVEREYAQLLRNTVGRLGMEDRVTFTGSLDGDDKACALEAAQLFVLPSLTETFGLAAAEAIAAGTPVIVTTGCGLAPLIHERVGLAVAPGSGPLRDAMQSLLCDPLRRDGFAARCKDFAATELSWSAAVTRLEAVLDEVVRG